MLFSLFFFPPFQQNAAIVVAANEATNEAAVAVARTPVAGIAAAVSPNHATVDVNNVRLISHVRRMEDALQFVHDSLNDFLVVNSHINNDDLFIRRSVERIHAGRLRKQINHISNMKINQVRVYLPNIMSYIYIEN